MIFYNKNYKKCNLSVFNKRIIIFVFLSIISILIIIIRLFYIQVINFNKYYSRSYNNCTKKILLNTKRGFIFDKNNIILAKNITVFKLVIYKNNNLKNDIINISKLINLSKDDINEINLLKNEDCKKKLIILSKDFSLIDIKNFLVNKYLFPNIKIKKKYIRHYPFKNICSHSIGYISRINNKELNKYNHKKKIYNVDDYIGKIGIEKKYEKYLKGKNGFKEIKINNLGKILGLRKTSLPLYGNDVYTSLDINLSIYVRNLIKKSKSAVIISDINGKILSLVSNPDFDLNKFSKKITNEEYKNILNNNSCPMLNRATQGIYPPASTVKPYILISSLNKKIIRENDLIFDDSTWTMPKFYKVYNDWNKNGRGWINLYNAIEESSDIYFYNLAYICGIDNIYDFMSNFEYNKKTGIDIEENNGNLPNEYWKKKVFKNKWLDGDTISVGIGQGYWYSTPIQMLKSLIILLNNGLIKKPVILDYIYDYNIDNIININNNIKNKYIKYKINIKYFNLVKNSMYNVAHGKNGTLKNSFLNSKYKIGSKTGTAQLFSLQNNKIYDEKKLPIDLRDHKMIVAFAPFDNPKFILTIILENGGLENYNIGYITRKIFDYLILKTDK
ncbi:penicillin-binding protein 2 [endosymbiont of Euscepes postfasciatus]|uniref:penicillin-binding protein 2 n=1 Tax=endosymbiont of Euscepes postfasciatus TaxID=650377 RepID=UPI000DC73DB5|nr:penicillin-binding protein 2 [endosymbiont of Euscepes postfasciatus]BBA84596.1 penicillin-binding protein 2 [endosymbiont of Euscepes postfasciatus]